MHPRSIVFVGLLALLTVLAPTAFAGGWAVTTLDEVPATLHAGETYAIGYTIRQHGQTPLVTSQSAIEIRNSGSGVTHRFVGQAAGPQGHYVAQVHFPDAGEWEWTADQAPFQRQALGAITVAEAAPANAAASVATAGERAAVAMEAGWPAPLRIALPLATALATLVFGWRLLVFVRPRPSAAPR